MSFFDDPTSDAGPNSSGGGDIWSTGAFAFDSPLKDLLDSGSYSLEDLLGEDELLQELRGMHPQLIDYFARVDVVAGLVRHLVRVPPPSPPRCPVRARAEAEAEEEAQRLARMREEQEAAMRAEAESALMDDPDVEASPRRLAGGSPPDDGDDDLGGSGLSKAAAFEEEEDGGGEDYPHDEDDGGGGGGASAMAASAAEEEKAKEEIDAPDDEIDDAGSRASGGDEEEGEKEQEDENEEDDGSGGRNDAAATAQPGNWMFGGSDDGDGEQHRNRQAGTTMTEREKYELEHVRYPYMACEVICCEVAGVLDALVNGRVPVAASMAPAKEDGTGGGEEEEEKEKAEEKAEVEDEEDVAGTTDTEIQDTDIEDAAAADNAEETAEECDDGEQQRHQRQPKQQQSLLDLLFTMLTTAPPLTLDDRRAGYLEKILTVLFRTRPAVMTSYLNGDDELGGGGPALLRALLDHLHSHSIMQIVQRLMLPPPPGRGGVGVNGAGEDGNDGGGDIDAADDDNPGTNAFGGAGGWPMISSGVDDDDDDEDEDLLAGPAGLVRCNWSENVDAVGWLLDRLTGEAASASVVRGIDDYGGGNEGHDDSDDNRAAAGVPLGSGCIGEAEDALLDASQNASEVIVAVVQNSPLSSATVRTLSSEPALGRVVDAVCFVGGKEGGGGGGGEFVTSESTVTLAMSVLESLILQLGGYGAVATQLPEVLINDDDGDGRDAEGGGGEPNGLSNNDNGNSAPIVPEDSGDADHPPAQSSASASPVPNPASANVLKTHLPRLLQTLSALLRHPTTQSWLVPVQYSAKPQQILGSSRLRIVRLIESLVLLGNAAVDELLCDSPALELCLDLFWAFPWCSMLHQSVANLLVHVLEGGLDRVELQRYFLSRCDLMGRLMASFDGVDVNRAAEAVSSGGALSAGSAASSSSALQIPSPPEQGEGESGPNQPRYSEVMFALKEYRSQESTSSSVDSERGSSVSSNSIEEVGEGGEAGGDEEVLPVSEDDVEAAIERQMQKVQDMEVSSSGSARMEDVVISDGGTTSQADVASGASQLIEPIRSETNTATAPASKPKQAEFRMGYMGHVIIVCQALVHACTVNDLDIDRNVQDNGEDAEGVEAALEQGEGVEDADSFDAEIEAAVLPCDMNGDLESSSLEVVLKDKDREEEGDEIEGEEEEQGHGHGQGQPSKKRKDRSFDEDDGTKSSSRRHDIEQENSQEIERPKADEDDEYHSSHQMDSGLLPDVSFPSSLNQIDGQEQEQHGEQSRPPIAHLMQAHPLYNTWQSFVTSTLASETAVQSTPLGGYNTSQTEEANGESHLHGHQQHRVSLTDEDLKKFMGEDPSGGVSGTIVAGAGGSPIDLDDADLDIAASMMEALSIPPSSGGATGTSAEDGTGGPGHHRQHRVMAGFGSVVQVAPTQGSTGGSAGAGQYLYDDPLGGRSEFDEGDSDDEEEERNTRADGQQGQADSEPGGSTEDEEDVPVIDLFAGNFSFENPAASSSGNGGCDSAPGSDAEEGGGGQGWANFANFDDAFAASAIPEPTPIAPGVNGVGVCESAAASSTGVVNSNSREMADIFASTPHLVDALTDDADDDDDEGSGVTS